MTVIIIHPAGNLPTMSLRRSGKIAIGPRDLANKTVEIARRDTLVKKTVSVEVSMTIYYSFLKIFRRTYSAKLQNSLQKHFI